MHSKEKHFCVSVVLVLHLNKIIFLHGTVRRFSKIQAEFQSIDGTEHSMTREIIKANEDGLIHVLHSMFVERRYVSNLRLQPSVTILE